MAKRQILIYLDNPSPGAEISWQVLDQQMRAGPIFRGDLKTAANHASGCRVVVMVPGQEILLTSIDLPGMNRQRLMRAVPFALEETVATDLDDLHFATGVRGADGRLAVAACDREHLEFWVELLREANINADVLIPALLAVAGETDRWRVMLESDAQDERGLVMLRQANGGISFERNNLEALLRLAIEQCPEQQRPSRIEFVQLNSDLSSDYVLENQELDTEAETVIQKHAQADSEQRIEPTLIANGRGDSLSEYVNNNDMTLPIGDRRQGRAEISQVGSQDLSYRDIEPVGHLHAVDTDGDDAVSTPTATSSISSNSEYQQRLDRQMATAISPNIQALCDEYHIALEYSSGDFTTLSYMAAQAVMQFDVNLLQGEFSRKEQLERILRPWIPAAAVAAIWLLIQAGLFGMHFIELSKKEHYLMQRMDDVYAQAFPEAKKTKFHLQEMKNRIANLKKVDVTTSGFIPLLHQAGDVLHEDDKANITAMRYKNDKIDITMEISDLQALDALKEKLINKAQLKVEILSASSRDGKVSSRIQVEPQS